MTVDNKDRVRDLAYRAALAPESLTPEEVKEIASALVLVLSTGGLKNDKVCIQNIVLQPKRKAPKLGGRRTHASKKRTTRTRKKR